MFNTGLAMSVANSFGKIFGGNKYFDKHGIDSYKKVFISSLCSGQVYFRQNKDKKSNGNAKIKALKRIAKVCGLFGIGSILSKFISVKIICSLMPKE